MRAASSGRLVSSGRWHPAGGAAPFPRSARPGLPCLAAGPFFRGGGLFPRDLCLGLGGPVVRREGDSSAGASTKAPPTWPASPMGAASRQDQVALALPQRPDKPCGPQERGSGFRGPGPGVAAAAAAAQQQPQRQLDSPTMIHESRSPPRIVAVMAPSLRDPGSPTSSVALPPGAGCHESAQNDSSPLALRRRMASFLGRGIKILSPGLSPPLMVLNCRMSSVWEPLP